MTKITDMEKLSEIQKKSGSWNIMLSFILLLCGLMMGTIIFQNTEALRSISNNLNDSKISSNIMTIKLQEIERKLDLLFLEKYNITPKTTVKK